MSSTKQVVNTKPKEKISQKKKAGLTTKSGRGSRPHSRGGEFVRQEAIQLIAQAIVVVYFPSISVELLRRLPQAFPLQGVVRKFTGLVSPHSGCTQNTLGEEFEYAGALTIYEVTGMI